MKNFKIPLLLLCFVIISQFSFSQDKVPTYSDFVVENPHADRDISAVTNFINALVNNKLSEAENLMTDTYMGYGPAVNDSVTKKGTIADWKQIHTTRTKQKAVVNPSTFRVLDGEFKGDWVSVWGTYWFTQNGKDIELPFQFTALINDGKLAKSAIYFDNLAVVLELGYTLTPPKTE